MPTPKAKKLTPEQLKAKILSTEQAAGENSTVLLQFLTKSGASGVVGPKRFAEGSEFGFFKGTDGEKKAFQQTLADLFDGGQKKHKIPDGAWTGFIKERISAEIDAGIITTLEEGDTRMKAIFLDFSTSILTQSKAILEKKLEPQAESKAISALVESIDKTYKDYTATPIEPTKQKEYHNALVLIQKLETMNKKFLDSLDPQVRICAALLEKQIQAAKKEISPDGKKDYTKVNQDLIGYMKGMEAHIVQQDKRSFLQRLSITSLTPNQLFAKQLKAIIPQTKNYPANKAVAKEIMNAPKVKPTSKGKGIQDIPLPPEAKSPTPRPGGR